MGLGIQTAVQILVEGLVLPVGGDDLFHGAGVFGIDVEGGSLVAGQLLEGGRLIVAVQFGIQDAVTGALLAATTGDELVIVDVDGHVLADVLEGLGPAQHQQFAFGLLHGFGEQQRALHVDMGLFAFKGSHQTVQAGMLFSIGIALAGDGIEKELFLFGISAGTRHDMFLQGPQARCLFLLYGPLLAAGAARGVHALAHGLLSPDG